MPPKLTRETVGLYLLYGAWSVFWLSLGTLVLCIVQGASWRYDLAAVLSMFGSFSGAYLTKDIFDVQPPIPKTAQSSTQFYDPAE